MSGSQSSPFSPKAVLAMLVVGAAAFLLLLYALSAGWTGDDNKGSGHAASNGLDGYSALVALLEKEGIKPTLSRREKAFEQESLLILTPPASADGDAISKIISSRRYLGPTLIIVPKWSALPLDRLKVKFETDVKPGWVHLVAPSPPAWGEGVDTIGPLDLKVGAIRKDAGVPWHGFGLSGTLPDSKAVQSFSSGQFVSLVSTAGGQSLAGYLDDGGWYPALAQAAGETVSEEDDSVWPVVIVSEPDLMNNYGMADQTRARAAMQIVNATLDDYDLPIVFDLTLNGLGRSPNLLTLAFTPPFLAATLCLILLSFLIAWRGFVRFGPPLRDAPAIALGKTQLARNGAALVERAKRLRLLGAPYAELMIARIAHNLGIRATDGQERLAAVARALTARQMSDLEFPQQVEALKNARNARDLLRAANALKKIERMSRS
ncbi:DUF4350 domain-containing protein [Altererythrobacter indicus]|uniref:DUF4350 domain-containing protein n=1 Tax=Altericroceibacterium indicum TaxID=374177 RepID=A0A845ABQ6_9SPHN|nr:DUF4350 domain-containing protein [Altericroceibacterium indicum]MXP25976.1 DUF4350 domain-containing protein [Altericroceibacterium indicum]